MKEVLLKHNYQWHDRSFDTGIKRNLLAKIIKTLDIRHVVAIAGARRSGKSYIFRQLIKHLIDSGVRPGNILQINFEDPFFISLRNDISIFENLYSEFLNIKNPAGKVYLFLDEIQNINNWQFWVRDIYDRNEYVKIFITGSNAELLSDELATHLTGRVLAFDNFPFSFTEYFKGLNDLHLPELTESYSPEKLYEHLYPYKEKLLHYIELSFKRGLFPEVAYLEDIELVKDILSQYFQNVLFRDIVRRFSIRPVRSRLGRVRLLVKADEHGDQKTIDACQWAADVMEVFEKSVRPPFRRHWAGRLMEQCSVVIGRAWTRDPDSRQLKELSDRLNKLHALK